jgi:hypothetical protein
MTKPSILPPTPEQIEDLRLAASKISGYKQRRFIADIALKYCDGNARKTDSLFGWGRDYG